MKECFKETHFGGEKSDLLIKIQSIVTEYQALGIRLTLRQLYYQLVARGFIPNTLRSYKNTGDLLSRARLAGVIDWSAIEDRGRIPSIPGYSTNIEDDVRGSIQGFVKDRREHQPIYAELWVEKDALSGILDPLAYEFFVPLVVNKGYSSSTAMYDASKRLIEVAATHEESVILYIGDHDPSGLDMVRDIQDRLAVFGVEEVEIRRVALTSKQIGQYRPPPNPAKKADSRYKKYVADHGRSCWEVDALRPEVLQKVVTDALKKVTDAEAVLKIVEAEENEKIRMMKRVFPKD